VLREPTGYLDLWSWVVMLTTFLMFIAALFLKGLGHDLLLEGAVFLVSVKLIMMAYKNNVTASKLNGRLDELQSVLARIEGFLGPRVRGETTQDSPTDGARSTAKQRATIPTKE
jgi:hypothetical protein